MYADPGKIRSHVVKIRLSDRENELIDAFVGYTGEQKAVLIRELVMEAVASSLSTHSNRVNKSEEVAL